MTQAKKFQNIRMSIRRGAKFSAICFLLANAPDVMADQGFNDIHMKTHRGGEIELGSAMLGVPVYKWTSANLIPGNDTASGLTIDNWPANEPVEETMSLATELAAINQPKLIKQTTRVQFFRNMFATLPSKKFQGNVENSTQEVFGEPRLDTANPTTAISVQQEAINSLQTKIAGREPPNPLMPLGILATALHLISNGVGKLMISKLGSGHLPIYSDDGEVIGTRDAITGQLSAGRDQPKDKGHVWKHQG